MQRLLWLIGALVLLVGCIGPIDYLNTVARGARRSVAEAEAVNAEKLSPYEYWSAVTYLQMAREKAARADFEDANKYGRRAIEMGELARKLAAGKAAAGPRAIQPPAEQAPAAGGQR